MTEKTEQKPPPSKPKSREHRMGIMGLVSGAVIGLILNFGKVFDDPWGLLGAVTAWALMLAFAGAVLGRIMGESSDKT
jgi:hypothetical protein